VFETHVPLALVAISVLPSVHAVPMRLAFLPLPYVRVLVQSAPDAVALLEALKPLTVVHLAIRPRVDALPVRLAYLEVTVVRILVGVTFEALAVSQVSLPHALVLPAVRVLHHTHALPLSLHHDADEDG